MREAADYSGGIPGLMEELRTKTLTGAERERGITRFDYTGTGYHDNFKIHYPKNILEAENDISTPELEGLEKLSASMGE